MIKPKSTQVMCTLGPSVKDVAISKIVLDFCTLDKTVRRKSHLRKECCTLSGDVAISKIVLDFCTLRNQYGESPLYEKSAAFFLGTSL